MTESDPAIVRRVLSVIIPVYGDWASLARCLSSVERYTDASDAVFIVNDCGPEADELEAGILPFVERNPQFHYSRNARNLGFIRTCNHAVLHLDTTGNDVVLLNSDAELTDGSLTEMAAVLDLSERHAAVSPRSDNATIATIPWRRHVSSLSDADRRERSARIIREIGPEIPRYYVAPVVVGFCMLLRRELIDNYGLFDEVFGAGYNEENDFCLRVNALGFSSVIANRALVFHVGSASFGEHERALESTNAAILQRRYPFYLRAVADFVATGYAAIDQFADLIVDPSSSRRVLIDLYHMSHFMNGSTKNILSFLEYLSRFNVDPSVQITLVAQPDSIDFFSLDSFGFDVVPWGSVDGIFDLGIALAPLTTPQQLRMFNRTCARWLLCHLDVIAIRSLQIENGDPTRRLAVRDSLIHAERVVTISQATVDDTLALFPDIARLREGRFVVIPQGSTRGAIRSSALPEHAVDVSALAEHTRLSGRPYVLIVGNAFPHKQLRRALEALASLTVSIVAFESATTSTSNAPLPPNLVMLGSGFLTDSEMDALYREAAVVVFPSAYEGFGLPIPDSLDQGTPVIVFDTRAAREVIDGLHAAGATALFSQFSELASLVTSVMADDGMAAAARTHAGRVRNITDFNRGIWQEAEALLAQPLDVSKLRARYNELVTSLGPRSAFDAEVISLSAALKAVQQSGSFRFGHVIAKAAQPVMRIVRRVRRVRRARGRTH